MELCCIGLAFFIPLAAAGLLWHRRRALQADQCPRGELLWDNPQPTPAATPFGASETLARLFAARGLAVDARSIETLPEPELVRLAGLVLHNRSILTHHVTQLFDAVGHLDGIPQPWSLRNKPAERKARITQLACALAAAGLAQISFEGDQIDVEVDGTTPRYRRFFGTGCWFEYAACDLLGEAASRLGQLPVVWRSVRVTVPGHGRRELDAVALVDRSLVILEAKSGQSANVDLDRFLVVARALSLRPDMAIALVLDEEPSFVTRRLGVGRRITVCSEDTLVAHLTMSMATAPAALAG